MLKIIQVGHNDASDRYIRNKMKAVTEAGMKAELVNLPETCNTNEVMEQIVLANADISCRAIIVQLPLPKHLDERFLLDSINPHKDIDGLGRYGGYYRPLTPCAVMRYFAENDIPLRGKTVCIFGRSELVGKPLANMMVEAGATVISCNSTTSDEDKRAFTNHCDILISAVGRPDTVHAVHMNANRTKWVIDIGINRDEFGKLCGDVSELARLYAETNDIYVSPVPGGVGKWTVRELVERLKQMEGVE